MSMLVMKSRNRHEIADISPSVKLMINSLLSPLSSSTESVFALQDDKICDQPSWLASPFLVTFIPSQRQRAIRYAALSEPKVSVSTRGLSLPMSSRHRF